MPVQTQPGVLGPFVSFKDRLASLTTLSGLYVLFWLFDLADVATCLLVGVSHEANPVVVLSARLFGPAGVLLLKAVGGLAFTGLCLYIQKRRPSAAKFTLALGASVMAFGFLDNSYVLWRLWQMRM